MTLDATADRSVGDVPGTTSTPLLTLDQVTKHFPLSGRRLLRAVDGVSLQIEPGRTLAVVGESGSGKSTLGRTVVRLNEPTSGRILFEGEDISHLSHDRLRLVRQRLQMVFQSPYTSLSPRMTVGDTLIEPLAVHHRGDREERHALAQQALEMVGLSASMSRRLPNQLSGGQRQRVGIARALMLRPRLIVADEPTASLDLTTQAQIVNLLIELQDDLGLALLFITHDLGLAKHLSHECAVIYLGKIVEMGPTDELMTRPLHPYTHALVSARTADRSSHATAAEIPSPINPPSGCHFRTRCPLAIEKCANEYPVLQHRADGRVVACHRAGEIDPPVQHHAPARFGVGSWPQPLPSASTHASPTTSDDSRATQEES